MDSLLSMVQMPGGIPVGTLAIGKHEISISADGYETWSQTIEVKEADNLPISVKLTLLSLSLLGLAAFAIRFATRRADATGKARTIQVEVRKKRVFVKREDTPTVAVVEEPAAPVIDEVELPKATKEAMHEISGAIIAITLVMASVFIPVAFMSGPVGIFYRQFSITMSTSIILSGVVALTLTPALCALMLKK